MSLSQGHVAGQNFSLTGVMSSRGFPKVRTGQPVHCRTGHFENEIGGGRKGLR